jgi:hypothetical protein
MRRETVLKCLFYVPFAGCLAAVLAGAIANSAGRLDLAHDLAAFGGASTGVVFIVAAVMNFLTFGGASVIFLGQISNDHQSWVYRAILLLVAVRFAAGAGFFHVPT